MTTTDIRTAEEKRQAEQDRQAESDRALGEFVRRAGVTNIFLQPDRVVVKATLCYSPIRKRRGGRRGRR
jgi:hypothetical protein